MMLQLGITVSPALIASLFAVFVSGLGLAKLRRLAAQLEALRGALDGLSERSSPAADGLPSRVYSTDHAVRSDLTKASRAPEKEVEHPETNNPAESFLEEDYNTRPPADAIHPSALGEELVAFDSSALPKFDSGLPTATRPSNTFDSSPNTPDTLYEPYRNKTTLVRASQRSRVAACQTSTPDTQWVRTSV